MCHVGRPAGPGVSVLNTRRQERFDHETPIAEGRRPGALDAVQETTAECEGAAAREGVDHRGLAPHRQTTHPQGGNWFQLYMWKARDRSMALVERAAAAGYDTLLVTVDVPVAGARLRDKRNGMSIPPALTLGTVVNALPRPQWWIDFLTTEPLAFASLDRWSGTVAELLDTMFDPTVTHEDLSWIKQQWPGKLVVKGIQSTEDARLVTELGADGIVLSNHG